MPKKTSRSNPSPTSASEDITNSAFSFASSAGELLNSLNNRPVSDVEGLQEVKHIGERFVEFACIPASKQKAFLFEITSALREWALGQISYGDYYHEYIKMRYDANALYRGLSRMIDMLKQPLPNAGIKLDRACGFVFTKRMGKYSKDYLVDLREQLSILIEGLDDAIQSLGRAGQARPNKNLSAINGYPRLTSLVFALGCAARRADGALTAHRKDGPKGTLILALNELRSCLLRKAPPLAELLPDRDRHPVANYERILKEARTSVFTPSDYFASSRWLRINPTRRPL
jgi:hypothetical protein